MRGKGRKKQYLYIVCCVLIEIHYVDFNQPQTHHYMSREIKDFEKQYQKRKMSWGKSKQIAEPLTNNEINTYTMVQDHHTLLPMNPICIYHVS